MGLVVQGDPTLPHVVWGHQWEWSSWGIPLSPLGKVPSWSPSSGSLPLVGFPQGIDGGFLGGAFSSQCNLLAEFLQELMQFMVSKVAKLCLKMMQSSHTWLGVASRQMKFPPLRVEVGFWEVPLPPLSYKP